MIFEKRLVLLVHVLCFLCARCDDDTFASSWTTSSTSMEPDYNTESTENYTCCDSTSMASLTSQDLGPTDSLDGSTIHENLTMDDMHKVTTRDGSSTTNFQIDTDESSFSTTEYTQTITTTDDATSSTTMKSTCNSVWPINATEDTREVINLKEDEIGTEWIKLSWEPPCKTNDRNISIMYLVERCDHDKNCNETNEHNTSHNATNLDACTQYTFTVKIITDYWRSDIGALLQTSTNDTISEIGEVRSLSVGAVDVSSVQLTWLAPEKHAKCISNYSIVQCIGQSCNETAVFVVNYTASNLEPCTQYKFNVKTVTLTVESVGVSVNATTASPIPSEPQSMEIIPSNFSLTVQWEPPQSGLTCLKHYQVTIMPKNSTSRIKETNITFTDLYSCTLYTVSVNAVNEADQNGSVLIKSNTTTRTRKNPPLLHDQGDLVAMNSISLVVSIEEDNNHCPLISLITICNHTSTNGTGYELLIGRSIENITSEGHEGSPLVMNTTVSDLSPFTEYICKSYIFNTAGPSDFSNGIVARTMEDVPSSPLLRVTKITESQFSLTWSEPEYLPGIVENYEIMLSWTPLFPIPAWCASETPKNDEIVKLNDTLSYDYDKVKAYRQYNITMRAKTCAGWGNVSVPQIIQSKAAISGAVSKLTYTIQENPNNINILDTIVSWGVPCSLNGELEFFNVSVHGIRDGYDNHTFFILEKCINYEDDYMCLVNLQELRGDYNYTFSVYPKTLQIDALGPVTSKDGILYPPGIPPQPEEQYVTWITINPFKAIKSTTTAAVLLPLFPDTNGTVKYYAIMVSEFGHNKPTSMRFDLTKKPWPNVFSWKEAMMSDFSITYQATRPKWNPYPDYVADYGNIKAVKFVIGAEDICKDISFNDVNGPLYCNGPLKPNTWYHVSMRAFTDGGYADSNLFVVKTNAELNVAIVIGIVFGILSLGILTTMMLLVRKCSPYVVLRRFLHPDMPGSPVPAPFTRKKFIAHCQQLIDNPGKLSNEFRLLQTLSVDLQMPTNAACLQANRKKNRYSDILPYDFSRVKLDVIDNDPNTDYINASFIRGYTGEDEYIACQGPKEETTYDFWRMVDQYNINIIVMLTQLIEKGKEKCHQYYPTIRETFRYENMTIRCTSELDFRTYTQRTLVLQKENKKRSIIQLHFKDWPDHDVPEDFDPMINFCQIMRRNITANKGFVVVHCSAGIGRTGTLIAIDILLQHLRDNRKLDVFGTVYRLRHQRINMVQRESQYAYIYNCIKQVLKNPYFLKTYKPPPVEPVYENISKKVKDTANTDANLVNNLEIQ
ncbi:phosphatidylinositol phosphatase PTPRQ isoform X2 [Odontomachus brunneus]|uniref:phosphatidylinositol phosphatase PTPRQ isoform X2 n=1 Tax=Odontomachus brunneus TaxID=486640 RepID=UPI0013F24DA2|nr:phosphatidylinositol phosphatase PTPRQ isoform X2 [Odontomachus brunneus]